MGPGTPIRADHRLIRRVIELVVGKQADPRRADVDRIAEVFCKAGGSWEGAFNGNPADLHKLKELAKEAFKAGLLTKAPRWDD